MSSGTINVATPKINAFFYRTNGIRIVGTIWTLRGMQKKNGELRSDLMRMAGTNLSEALSVTKKRRMHKSQALRYSWIARQALCVCCTALLEDKKMEQFHTFSIRATLVLWVMAECSLAGGYRCFKWACHLHHQTRYRPTRLHGVIIRLQHVSSPASNLISCWYCRDRVSSCNIYIYTGCFTT